MPNITQIPAPRVPVVDGKSGLITTQWFRYFNNLNTILGSGTGITTPVFGGTGTNVIPTSGQLLIGNFLGSYTVTYLTTGAGLFSTVGDGSLAVGIADTGVTAGDYGSATQVGTFTVNNQGQITLANNLTITPSVNSISGLGVGVATALAVNVESPGSFVLNGGALGTPLSGTVTNLTGTASININGSVGSTTPNTGAFTTLSATGQLTLTNSSNYNLFVSGTGNNYLAGKLGINSTILTQYNVRIALPITGAVGSFGVRVEGGIQSDVTSLAQYFNTSASTAAASFTLTSLYHYSASQGSIGAGSTVTNQYGFVAGPTLVGATNNYGFYSNIASGTGRFNFYANGTAANVFVGTTSIGGVVGAESLRIPPVASSVNYLQIEGSSSTTPTISAQGSSADVDINLTPKGTGNVRFGTYTAGVLAQTGYITIKDAGGTTRRLLVG